MEGVEQVRIGTLIAQDRRSLARWRAHVARILPRSGQPGAALRGRDGAGLTGIELERTLLAMRVTNGDIVAVRHVPRLAAGAA